MTRFWIMLAAGTVFLLVFSWFSSIREKRTHGYPRFFAFEGVFVLILLNERIWFRDPFSFLQVVSWLFLLASIAVVLAGFLALARFGKPRGGDFEDTTRLVDRGIFRLIRHPMYASLIYLGFGAFLKDVDFLTGLALTVVCASSWITALVEESEMKKKFGGAYLFYMKRTKRFIPFLI
jgi:protein-S-isoprenylcysteine O-methyltransferase Ste14